MSVRGTTLRYSVGGRAGPTALDLARAADGDGYRYLDRALAEIVSGTTANGGALLGPLSIRYIVAANGDLPASVLQRLDQQVDLDLVRAQGLTIYRNAAFLPEAWGSSRQDYIRAAHSGSLLDLTRLPVATTVALAKLRSLGREELRASFRPGGIAVLSQQFDSGWQADVGARPGLAPRRAFGWATGFDLPGGTARIEYAQQWVRTTEMSILAALWVVSLWFTRKPSRPARPRRAPVPAVPPAEMP
jgi:hypothetical protein